ncbi:Hsp20/alpha crystallin family protein [Allopusillimonas ginsengisoli]|uniref:Hsp20/alpha crystallin family protein n=1 Tax=Allopusillimonas ginsengisoli TaxID=453575 RepID=UPI0010222346|nr:Hsp20/alpha crystallin family protein [Allopusillimonas ginsengisoli]TEA76965.1 Hsp20/alpha crystallin family protein [Allopusillimonas ginsengisoli]
MVDINPGTAAHASDSAHERDDKPEPMTPAVDVYEDDNGITLWADLPGVPKEQISIHIQNNALTIQGTIELGSIQSMQPIHTEITSAHYQRIFTLSRDLDADKVRASFNAGVLHVRIPKLMQESARRVDVRVE